MFAVNLAFSLNSDISSLRRPYDASGSRRSAGVGKNHVFLLGKRVAKSGPIQAVISQGDKELESAKALDEKNLTEPQKPFSSLSSPSVIAVKAVITIRKKMKQTFAEKIQDQWEHLVSVIGQGIVIQLVSEEVDHVTNSGKSVETPVRGWLPRPSNSSQLVQFTADFTVPSDFGHPGAILITNLHNREFYLVEVVIQGFDSGPLFFPANTWIHPQKANPYSRIIFTNQACLPSQTPPGIRDLRREDLLSLRGNGKGERKPYDRVYDYDVYNDLGNPDKDKNLARPILGGKERPYPRRCRTGRPPAKSDPLSESRTERPQQMYAPRDEAFEELKEEYISMGKLKALLHVLLPSIDATLSKSDHSFNCFSDIDKLYNNGLMPMEEEDQENAFSNSLLLDPVKEILNVGKKFLKYDVPEIMRRDRFSWLRESEFARQTLAGANPVSIELLKEFPIISKLDPVLYGPPQSAITKELVEKELHGMSVEQAIEEKRLFILDYHDMLLPFIKKINSLPDRKAYASRTVFFYNPSGILLPIAIELSLPPTPTSPQSKRVFTHGHDATTNWIWKLAKAHVSSNDAVIHHIVNHWLRIHACTEPYIIATHRQLSTMHPIYKLLHPHMRYTLEINSFSRESFISEGGIVEACYGAGKYAMELSSAAYKNMWRFDMEGLPADLIRRGMAVEDPSMPCGVKLVIEDYPFAADGLLVWSAIQEWVQSYVEHFYSDSQSIVSDIELQSWWGEIKDKGHHDKRDEPWWPRLETKEDLCSVLTTMIWTVSGQHAAIHFGQYPFGGYMPNRPSLMRKLMPQENEPDFEKFMMDPMRFFLSSLPSQLQTTKVMAVQEASSLHSPDEEYLGKLHEKYPHWINDYQVVNLYYNFSAKLEKIREIIDKRNKDYRLKNRSGAGVLTYELLLPKSDQGGTGRGIPNSVSV